MANTLVYAFYIGILYLLIIYRHLTVCFEYSRSDHEHAGSILSGICFSVKWIFEVICLWRWSLSVGLLENVWISSQVLTQNMQVKQVKRKCSEALVACTKKNHQASWARVWSYWHCLKGWSHTALRSLKQTVTFHSIEVQNKTQVNSELK